MTLLEVLRPFAGVFSLVCAPDGDEAVGSVELVQLPDVGSLLQAEDRLCRLTDTAVLAMLAEVRRHLAEQAP